MKKFCIFFLLSCILIVTAFSGTGCVQTSAPNERYLRIHIRADSDQEQAQAVKYAVRDALVEALAPMVAECESFDEAAAVLKQSEGLRMTGRELIEFLQTLDEEELEADVEIKIKGNLTRNVIQTTNFPHFTVFVSFHSAFSISYKRRR